MAKSINVCLEELLELYGQRTSAAAVKSYRIRWLKYVFKLPESRSIKIKLKGEGEIDYKKMRGRPNNKWLGIGNKMGKGHVSSWTYLYCYKYYWIVLSVTSVGQQIQGYCLNILTYKYLLLCFKSFENGSWFSKFLTIKFILLPRPFRPCFSSNNFVFAATFIYFLAWTVGVMRWKLDTYLFDSPYFRILGTFILLVRTDIFIPVFERNSTCWNLFFGVLVLVLSDGPFPSIARWKYDWLNLLFADDGDSW